MGALLDIIGTVHNVGGGEKDINYSYPIRVFYAKGAALLVRKTLFEKINGFDDSFFLWRDEVDLCWRVQLCGYIILAVPMAIVYHHGSAIINRSVPNLTMEFYFIRNNIRMLIKNYSSSNLLKYLPLFLVVYGVLTLHKMVTAKKPQYSVVYLKAVCWNLINLRETMSERKKIQTYIRKVADQSLLGTVLFKSLFSLKSRIEIKIPKFETRASEIE
jgi:GT2 family glycosyltransferase